MTLQLQNISKTYLERGQAVSALRNISPEVKEKEFVAFVGPSGCGKTTLLKIIAGLVAPTDGVVMMGGRIITTPGKDRGMVFQQSTLFPWLTVADNIAFGLRAQKMPEEFVAQRVQYYLEVTGLTEFKEALPRQLSGGMQQRVAIARTLANNPRVLLMDEPFGALDAQTRAKMQDFLLEVWERERLTVLFVTHDVEEAVYLADTVYVLSNRPAEIKKKIEVPFTRPRTRALKRVGDFLNLVEQIERELE